MKDPQLRRGLLEACVLAALCRGESHGYQIVKDLTPSVSIGGWRKPAAWYTAAWSTAGGCASSTA